MVILPSGLTFVATPRTASRAISEALLAEYPDAISDYPMNHHMWPEAVPKDYPIYTVVRNPVDQMLSWWVHVDLRQGSKRRPLQFAQEYDNIMFMPRYEDYSLNIYAEIADHFMPYDSKLKSVKKTLKLNSLEVVGKSNYRVSDKERVDLKHYMNKDFKADMELWREHRE